MLLLGKVAHHPADRLGPLARPRLGEERRDVEFPRKQAGDAQQSRDIVDVGIDAFRDTGILHLDREHAAVW